MSIFNFRNRILPAVIFAITGFILNQTKSDAQSVSYLVNGVSANAVSASTSFSASGDTLTMMLTNTTAGGTLNRSDLLCSVYFSFANGTNPTLNYLTATGTVTPTSGADLTNQDLRAVTNGQNTWAYQSFSSLTFSGVSYEHGLSTVGNSSFTGGAFPGSLVGNDDYAIIAPGTNRAISGLNNIPLVRNSVTYTFSGFTGRNLSDIDHVLFGFTSSGGVMLEGTKFVVPEPSTYAMFGGMAFAGFLGLRRRIRSRRK